MSATLIRALNHPVRREALRLLHRSGESKSAVQMSRSLRVSGEKLSYHLKVLAELGAVARAGERRVRGVPEKFFASEVSDHERIIAILADTERDDDAIRR